MSQSYKVLHEFKSLTVGQTLLQVSPVGTSATLSNTQSGYLSTLNSTSGSSVRLPAPSAGLSFPFVVSALGPHTITAPASTLFGCINCAVPTTGSLINLTNVTGSSVLLTTSGSTIGDRITFVSDGTKYFVSGTISQYNGCRFL